MLKLEDDTRSRFREAVKGHGTMQSVLAAFVESYIDGPDNFKLKLEVGYVRNGNGNGGGGGGGGGGYLGIPGPDGQGQGTGS